MKGYGIYVKNNLLEDKHRVAMREALWLYLWLLDKVTAVHGDMGVVLGRKPIKYEDFEKDFPSISRRTFYDWLTILEQSNYIKRTKTPYGSSIFVLKIAKLFKNIPVRDTALGVRDTALGVRDTAQAVRQTVHLSAANCTSNKDNTVDNTVNNTVNNTNTINNNVEPATQNEDVQLVYNHFLEKFKRNKNLYKLTTQRTNKIKARLKDAGLEMLLAAITQTGSSEFHTGKNDRHWKADLDFIIRSYEQVEKLSQLETKQAVIRPPMPENKPQVVISDEERARARERIAEIRAKLFNKNST